MSESIFRSAEKVLRDHVLSRYGFVLMLCFVTAGSLLVAGVIYRQGERDLATARQSHWHQAHGKAVDVHTALQLAFNQIYQNIRTISRLPSVRDIDRHATNLSPNARTAIHEIYNNLKTNIDVSEIYILPADFNPEATDPVTGKSEKPILALEDFAETVHHDEEAEIHSHRLMVEQLIWFKRHYPTMESISGLKFPAITGREVIISDHSYYSPEAPDDADRSGYVYSVPFYNTKGEFAGQVSALFLTRALRAILPAENYALVNAYNQQVIFSGVLSETQKVSMGWIRKALPNPDLVYSEVLPLSVIDGFGQWTLWAGLPDKVFQESPQVRAIRLNQHMGCATALLFGGISVLFLFVARGHFRRVREELIRAKEGAESASREQADFLSNIIQNAVDGMITIDMRGIVQTFNPACERIFGYSAEEVIGKNIAMLMPEPYHSEHDGYLRNYHETGDAKIIGIGREVRGRHKDGTEMDIDLSVSEVMLKGRKIYSGIVRDISDRKSGEMQMQTYLTEMEWLRSEAEKATRLKSEFLAMMSHEIRTPMNGVLGMMELLRETGLNDQQKRYAGTAVNSAHALLDIINDILDFSKIEAGRLTLEPLPIDLSHVLGEIIELFTPRASEKGLRLLFTYDQVAERHVVGDAVRIRQVVSNLLSNAIKFTEKGRVELIVERLECMDPSRAHIKISVKDSGIGIPLSVQSTLFGKFVQADASTTRKYGGTGLGLAICKQLAALMNGEVGLESVLGQGATFWFTMLVPIAAAESVKTIHAAAADVSDLSRLKGSKILLTEDNAINQEFALAVLKGFGCDVTLAVNGQEALRLVREGNAYDVILMDCQMPEMDGYEATGHIRAYFREKEVPHVPIIAMTAHAMQGEKKKCLAAGMDDFLTKPFLKNQLAQMLKHWVTGACDMAPSEPAAAVVVAAAEDIIDVAAVEQVRELMADRYAEVVEKFLINADAIISKMEEILLRKGSAADMAREAHTLKSSSGYLGAVAVSGAAKELEAAAKMAVEKGRPVDDLRAGFEILKGAWEKTRPFYESKQAAA